MKAFHYQTQRCVESVSTHLPFTSDKRTERQLYLHESHKTHKKANLFRLCRPTRMERKVEAHKSCLIMFSSDNKNNKKISAFHLSTSSYTVDALSVTPLQHSGTHFQKDVRFSLSVSSFRSALKTHLFPT